MMKKALLATLCLSSLVILAVSPAWAPTYPPDLDLDKKVWKTIQQPHNNSLPLNNDSNGSLYFTWPASDPSCVSGTCTSMHYLSTSHVPSSISGALVITLNVQTTGTPEFHFFGANGGGIPPSVRALVWAHQGNSADDSRWWAHDVFYTLGPGTVTMAIPIDPANFSNVNGVMGNANQAEIDAFNSAMADVYSLGVTFGGGSNYGHGIYVTGGTATFTLQNYEVVPSCPAVTTCSGVNCVTSGVVSATSTGLDQCVTASGVLIDCDNGQTVNVVTANCTSAPCCSNPIPCICSACGATGQYLACQ